MTEHTWRKASRSQNGADCVEVRGTLDLVRDSKNPNGPALCADMRVLTLAIKAGQLDR